MTAQNSVQKFISIGDKKYPPQLKEIYDPPPILYYQGRWEIPQQSLAVVGSRKISNYGQRVTKKLVCQLAEAGLTIISGLALGVDALAHESALKSGAQTIAVLGTNPQEVYPVQNQKLAQEILKKDGLIMSEFPPETLAYPTNFPRRNRIISGLARGVLIIEAAQKSGALITARLALEQNREVFAVPGSIFSLTSHGTNELIQKGAHPVTSAQDILEILNLTLKSTPKTPPAKLTPEKKLILENLSNELTPIDQLIKSTGLDTACINSTLTIMELEGLVENLGGNNYVKT